MESFVLDLKKGNTIEEMMSIAPARQKELANLIFNEIKSTNPPTMPEALQIICKHCRNLNELVYYVFLVGKNFGADEVKNGFVSLGHNLAGGFGLTIYQKE